MGRKRKGIEISREVIKIVTDGIEYTRENLFIPEKTKTRAPEGALEPNLGTVFPRFEMIQEVIPPVMVMLLRRLKMTP